MATGRPGDGESARWRGVAERGSRLGLSFTVFCARFFGRLVSVPVVMGVVTYFWATDRAGRAASRAYLERVYRHPEGARALGTAPGIWTTLRHYVAFASTILDRIEVLLGRGERFEVAFDDHRAFAGIARGDRGAIVVSAHLGSFEMLRARAELDDIPVNVVMDTRHAPMINQVFRRISPDAELRVLGVDPSSTRAALEIRACIERGELVAILADRIEAAERGRVCRTPLLGAEVALPTAPFELAGVLECPVVMMLALRTGTRRYRVRATRLAERVPWKGLSRIERARATRSLVESYASVLGESCLDSPLQWFNFFDYWGELGS